MVFRAMSTVLMLLPADDMIFHAMSTKTVDISRNTMSSAGCHLPLPADDMVFLAMSTVLLPLPADDMVFRAMSTVLPQSKIYRRGNVENGWESLIMVDHA